MKKISLLLLLQIAIAIPSFSQKEPVVAGRVEIIGGKTFHHFFVKANGIKQHFVKGGNGIPVILLHGWPQTWHEWIRQLPGLSEKYTVIAVDLRGAGETDKPDSGYNKQSMAKDIYALITELGYDKVIVIGHDIGGMVAYSFSGLYPEKLLALGIGDVPLPGFEPVWSYISNDPRAWHFNFYAVPEVPELLVKGHEKEFLRHFMLSVSANKKAVTEKDIEYYANWLKIPGNLRGGFEYYRAFKQDAEENKPLFTRKIQVPVFAFGGQFTMGENQGTMMKALAENVTAVTISNSGHWVTEENTEQFNAALFSFLAKL